MFLQILALKEQTHYDQKSSFCRHRFSTPLSQKEEIFEKETVKKQNKRQKDQGCRYQHLTEQCEPPMVPPCQPETLPRHLCLNQQVEKELASLGGPHATRVHGFDTILLNPIKQCWVATRGVLSCSDCD